MNKDEYIDTLEYVISNMLEPLAQKHAESIGKKLLPASALISNEYAKRTISAINRRYTECTIYEN